jgi:hypothetical protein
MLSQEHCSSSIHGALYTYIQLIIQSSRVYYNATACHLE